MGVCRGILIPVQTVPVKILHPIHMYYRRQRVQIALWMILQTAPVSEIYCWSENRRKEFLVHVAECGGEAFCDRVLVTSHKLKPDRATVGESRQAPDEPEKHFVVVSAHMEEDVERASTDGGGSKLADQAEETGSSPMQQWVIQSYTQVQILYRVANLLICKDAISRMQGANGEHVFSVQNLERFSANQDICVEYGGIGSVG